VLFITVGACIKYINSLHGGLWPLKPPELSSQSRYQVYRYNFAVCSDGFLVYQTSKVENRFQKWKSSLKGFLLHHMLCGSSSLQHHFVEQL